jgi:hypothetical protein
MGAPSDQHHLDHRHLAHRGGDAEVCCKTGVDRSLPPLALALTILHELGHLAAGDHLIDWSAEDQVRQTGVDPLLASIHPGRRLARRLPLRDERHREREADLRASYALIAGCLGADSPYAVRMFDVL